MRILVSFFLIAFGCFGPISPQQIATVDRLSSSTSSVQLYMSILVPVLGSFLEAQASQNSTDWANFKSVVDKILEKCSSEPSFWTTPFMANNQSVILKNYMIEQLFYAMNPLSSAPSAIKTELRKAIVTLINFVEKNSSVVGRFDDNSCLLLSTASDNKFLMVQDDGKVALASSVSFLDRKLCFRATGVTPEGAFVLQAFNNRFFDRSLKFTGLANNSGGVVGFTFVRNEGTLNGFLQAANKKFLQIDATGNISLGDNATELKIIEIPAVVNSFLRGSLPAKTSDDLDASIFTLVQVFECCAGNQADLAICAGVLKEFCTQASAIPDWSLIVNKQFLRGVFPAIFIKNYIKTILNLKRYSFSDELKKDLKEFIEGAVFSSAKEMPTIVANDVFTAVSSASEAGISCYDPKTNLFYFDKTTNDFDPLTHIVLSDFNPDDYSASLTINGKKINIDSSGFIVVGASDAGVFKLFQSTKPQEFFLVSANNKRLSFDSSFRIGFVTGTPLVFKKLPSSRRVMGSLSSNVFEALVALNKACFDNRADRAALDTCLQAIINLVNQKKNEDSWYAEKGSDVSGQLVTANEYVISIFQTVQNNSKDLFTGLTQETSGALTTIIGLLNDKSVIYPKKINYLIQLMQKEEVKNLTATSTLGAEISEMARLLVNHNSPQLRSSFVAELDKFYEAGAAKNLQDPSAWHTTLFNASLAAINVTEINAAVAEEVVGYLKQTIVPRLLKLNLDLRMILFKVLCDGVLKKVVDRAVASSFPAKIMDDLKEIVKTLKDLQKNSSIAADNTAATTSILSLDALVNPRQRIDGMRSFDKSGLGMGAATDSQSNSSGSNLESRQGFNSGSNSGSNSRSNSGSNSRSSSGLGV